MIDSQPDSLHQRLATVTVPCKSWKVGQELSLMQFLLLIITVSMEMRQTNFTHNGRICSPHLHFSNPQQQGWHRNGRCLQTYNHHSLPLNTGSQCIRVLQLEVPNPNEADGGALHGDLRIIDLATAPTPGFTALSYVCGDIEEADPSSIVTLGPDRLVLQLTNNCHEALKHLRSIIRPLTIWVDAISIYQYDIGEKNHQIPLMGEIYSQAGTTFIWLGPPDPACYRAIKCLYNVGLLDYYFSSTDQNAGASTKPRPWLAAAHLFRGEAFEPDEDDIIRFLDSQYMHRLWTYQEVVLSRNPVIVRGTLTFPWWRFAVSILYLSIWAHRSVPRRLPKLRWLWRSLALDRNKFHFTSDTNHAQDLRTYRRFLTNVGDAAERSAYTWFAISCFTVAAGTSCVIYATLQAWLSLAMAGFGTALLGLTGAVLVDMRTESWSGGDASFLDMAEEAERWSVQNTVLSAIWSRQCREPQDVNFATRNIVRVLTETELTSLSYFSPLGEVYQDLTANMLRLTEYPELIVAALRSHVPGAPSWTIDWLMRRPLRIYPTEIEQSYDLFYDAEAATMAPGSWRLDPARPKVLQIKGRSLGRVRAVFKFRNPDDAERAGELAHVHNFKVLSVLAEAELNSIAPSRIRTLPSGINRLLHQLLRITSLIHESDKGSNRSTEEIVSSLLEPLSHPFDETYVEHINSALSPDKDLGDPWKDLCAWMEDKCIVLTSRAPDDFYSTGLFDDFILNLEADRVFLAKLEPAVAPSASDSENDNSLEARFQDCRIRPGDMVLEVYGLKDERAVVRNAGGDSFTFVDALENMFQEKEPGRATNRGEMRFFDII